MNRTTLKVVLLDIVLLVVLAFVVQDIQWRVSFAASPHNACGGVCSYAPSFSYNVLVQFFTMSSSSVQLTSPPTLDWVQVIVYALVILNGWFVYTRYSGRNAPRPSAAAPTAA